MALKPTTHVDKKGRVSLPLLTNTYSMSTLGTVIESLTVLFQKEIPVRIRSTDGHRPEPVPIYKSEGHRPEPVRTPQSVNKLYPDIESALNRNHDSATDRKMGSGIYQKQPSAPQYVSTE